ncbi:MAG: hypothetical protein A3G34_14780 [Candidatus Lindowbacteria bacterium RIFCSPLOWO2_12_FULL_62_27]|nr:MAG: hypothetical protein A3I06_10060 [Candidatus Lindowbacteria bacterium RIFCSPLOWO2_02_FULL_62_12]OGH63121.1 MAG: hypothetical protein A3G34_14780 [Candidatus Lindowbacteria bacterium RIFCSPLOWO2_12_FULL_62_27]
MSRTAVLLRADGGPGIGGGHVMRARTLSDALLDEGFDVHLFSKDNAWIRSVQPMFRCRVRLLKAADNESLILFQSARRLGARLIVLDVQSTSPEYVKYLQGSGATVITIDDPGLGADAADATFRAGHKLRRENNYYYGFPYAILPPALLKLRDGSREPEAVRSAVIFLGTFDARGYGRWIPDIAGRFPQIAFSWFTDSAAAPHANLQILGLSQNLFWEKLAAADLAIISGGVTLYETTTLGRPAVVLPQAPHETEQAKFFADAGAVCLVDPPSFEQLAGVLSALAGAKDRLAAMHDRSMELADGRGLERFLEAVRRLLSRSTIAAG